MLNLIESYVAIPRQTIDETNIEEIPSATVDSFSFFTPVAHILTEAPLFAESEATGKRAARTSDPDEVKNHPVNKACEIYLKELYKLSGVNRKLVNLDKRNRLIARTALPKQPKRKA